ncbi:SPL family radical SAM protein [Lachnotalea sp. AF33-28]|uniref:SPL family radical SAM protein n=1 Tax=Lachnotalea sp. AF33-28 TaxID=2292046 RepID=UPI000E530A36|nr:radical SAM protein [Lachnotalea sp. AF33-28]RHP34443.1 radical SAM protein [Lachnotalea sp. AF33-28]
MNSLSRGLFNPYFSHIYIEEALAGKEETEEVLRHFPHAVKVKISHYKDVFCRSRQDCALQKQSPSLILAAKQEHLIYPGAPVCQDFGNRHFYYTSCVMNCVYDCEYCYLQGMYPSSHMVVFLNLEDVFVQTEILLKDHPVYLCISYDTDLLALEPVFGCVRRWISFAAAHPSLTIEIRTKSAGFHYIGDLAPLQNVIFAWTLSPEEVCQAFERHTPSLHARLASAAAAADRGWPIRLCFDPLLYIKDWKRLYQELVSTVFQTLSPDSIKDASIGVFRVSSEYLKRMKQRRPVSVLLHYPYENENGVCYYGKERTEELTREMQRLLLAYLPEEKLFIWRS